ncbi:hypothetical protein NQZ68_007326 [Dissostichus eleginoides]|nr:hypothetical protein NQZ68_007326 [Dissostichus eleginoides]
MSETCRSEKVWSLRDPDPLQQIPQGVSVVIDRLTSRTINIQTCRERLHVKKRRDIIMTDDESQCSEQKEAASTDA